MSSYHFNNRAEGIFAEGFFDCDGKPVRDTFVWQMRAKLVGIAAAIGRGLRMRIWQPVSRAPR